MDPHDEQRQAEQLDPEVLGQELDEDRPPVTADFPPDEPLGVEDPSILQGGSETRDDALTREWRRRDEEKPLPPPDRDDDPGPGRRPVRDRTVDDTVPAEDLVVPDEDVTFGDEEVEADPAHPGEPPVRRRNP